MDWDILKQAVPWVVPCAGQEDPGDEKRQLSKAEREIYSSQNNSMDAKDSTAFIFKDLAPHNVWSIYIF